MYTVLRSAVSIPALLRMVTFLRSCCTMEGSVLISCNRIVSHRGKFNYCGLWVEVLFYVHGKNMAKLRFVAARCDCCGIHQLLFDVRLNTLSFADENFVLFFEYLMINWTLCMVNDNLFTLPTVFDYKRKILKSYCLFWLQFITFCAVITSEFIILAEIYNSNPEGLFPLIFICI